MDTAQLADAGVTSGALSDRYELGSFLGRGTFGDAHVGTRVADGGTIVLKRVRISDLTDKEKQDALSEVLLLSQFRHTNIIHYHESIIEDGVLNIVTEYAEGGELSAVIQQRAEQNMLYSEDQIMFMFVQILLALLHVHGKDVLHRDIKSQNIFLSKNGILKLGDFGVARILNSASMAKTWVGTPYYFSPEMCEGQPYNSKSDVWSLGCLLYELTTLKRAFDGNCLPALVMKIMQGRYPPIPSKFSLSLRKLTDSMLQQSPKARPSIQDILRLTYVQKHVTRYAKYMMENSQGEEIRIGLEQIPCAIPQDNAAAVHPTSIGTRRRNSATAASTDCFKQAAYEIAEQADVGPTGACTSGPPPFQPGMRQSTVTLPKKTSSARAIGRPNGGIRRPASASTSAVHQIHLDVKVKPHELENRAKVEAQKERKRQSALERDRKKREEADRKRLEKQQAMEAKARERAKRIEQEKEQRARREELDAQLKEKERERAKDREEATKRIHQFKAGLKSVRPTLKRSVLKAEGAKFAERQGAVLGAESIPVVMVSASSGSATGESEVPAEHEEPAASHPEVSEFPVIDGRSQPDQAEGSRGAREAASAAGRRARRGRQAGKAPGSEPNVVIYTPAFPSWGAAPGEEAPAPPSEAPETNEAAAKAEVCDGLREVRDFSASVRDIWDSRHAGRELLQVLDEIQDVLEADDAESNEPSDADPEPGLEPSDVTAARIEQLRMSLELKLGESKLLQMYRGMQAVFREDFIDERGRQELIEKHCQDGDVHVVWQLSRLIMMEDTFNESQTG